jgi:ABC-2 type transport system permease protein
MRSDVARLDLRLRRRGIIGYTLGLAAYAFLIVALYPAFRNDTSLDALTKESSTLSALFGASGALTTPDGWMNANLYANFVPLFVLLMTIGYGAGAIAGQDEDGTLSPIAALPISRTNLLLQKALALTALSLPVPAVTFAFAIIGQSFQVQLGADALLGTTVGVVLLGLDFGLLALAVGASTGSRGVALGLAGTLAAASYVISSLAMTVHWMRPLRYTSLFYWSVGDRQLVDGLSTSSLLVLLGTGVGLAVLALVGFRRVDLH